MTQIVTFGPFGESRTAEDVCYQYGGEWLPECSIIGVMTTDTAELRILFADSEPAPTYKRRRVRSGSTLAAQPGTLPTILNNPPRRAALLAGGALTMYLATGARTFNAGDVVCFLDNHS